MKSQSLFEGERLTVERSIELTIESLQAYGERYRHWAIAYSGGKDSSGLVTLIAWLIQSGRIPAPESVKNLRFTGIFAIISKAGRVLVTLSPAEHHQSCIGGLAMPFQFILPLFVSQEPSKACRKCRSVKAASEYSPDKRNKDGLQSNCRTCQRAYRATRLEQERAYQKARHTRNPDRERERVKIWRKQNPDKVRAQNRRHHENNRDARNAQSKERTRRHYREKPELYKINVHVRRARKKANGGKFTALQWAELKHQYDYHCLCCGRREPEIQLTPDHVVPLSRGGSNDISNIQPLCLPCNNRKRARTIDYRLGYTKESA